MEDNARTDKWVKSIDTRREKAMKGRRKLEGKTRAPWAWTPVKIGADNGARQLRKEGFRVRVVKIKDGYVIYKLGKRTKKKRR